MENEGNQISANPPSFFFFATPRIEFRALRPHNSISRSICRAVLMWGGRLNCTQMQNYNWRQNMRGISKSNHPRTEEVRAEGLRNKGRNSEAIKGCFGCVLFEWRLLLPDPFLKREQQKGHEICIVEIQWASEKVETELTQSTRSKYRENCARITLSGEVMSFGS